MSKTRVNRKMRKEKRNQERKRLQGTLYPTSYPARQIEIAMSDRTYVKHPNGQLIRQY